MAKKLKQNLKNKQNKQLKKSRQQKVFTIDAQGKVMGRLASQVATLLIGKNETNFVPYLSGTNIVQIKNVHKIKITGRKMTSKFYYHHSGYPGGLKKTPLQTLFRQDPQKLFRQIVYGMLPKNKLRSQRIKRLKFI